MKNLAVLLSALILAFTFATLFVCCSGGGDDDDSTDDDITDDDSIDDDVDDDDADDDDDDDADTSYRITNVDVEDCITYRLTNPIFPQYTGDLWPCAWGDDDRLYTSNGDGIAFGYMISDIVFSVVDGYPTELTGYAVSKAYGNRIAGKWGPNENWLSRKPTGLVCIDGAIYLFFQNLKNPQSDNPFGDAPHASVSVTYDKGLTWYYDASEPMFTDHVFTTGFFLDYGKCQEHAIDDYVYTYGLDYNWRYSEGFSQTKMYLERVPKDSILDISAWEFFTGFSGDTPTWSENIENKIPVLEDDTLYTGGYSGIAQGSVVYIPQLNRYIYSTRAYYQWIFYEARYPWGPWTKVSVIKWTGGWTENFHAGYNVVIPSKFLGSDGLGGWIVSSLSSSLFDGMYYNMGFRRFWLEVEQDTSKN